MTSLKPAALILLLDIDGTLVDTDKHLSSAMVALFAKYGVDFKAEEFFESKTFHAPNEHGVMVEQTTMLFGGAWEMVYHYLKSKNPHTDPGAAAFRSEIIEYVTSHHDDVAARQDVIDMIVALRAQCEAQGIGFTAIAVTNGARKEALANLAIVEAAGLTVDKLVSADDVTYRKPHEEPYLQGHQHGCDRLAELGYVSANALVIKLEDSPPGAKSACIAAQRYNGTCYYMPTTRRPILMPQLTPDEADHFIIEQNIATLGLLISKQLHGRGTLPHEVTRIPKVNTQP